MTRKKTDEKAYAEYSERFKENLEIQTIPYKITLNAQHGLPTGTLDKTKELELILFDAIYKAQALFWCVEIISNMAVGGHHKFNSEQMLTALDEIGQMGFAICDGTLNPIEKLASINGGEK